MMINWQLVGQIRPPELSNMAHDLIDIKFRSNLVRQRCDFLFKCIFIQGSDPRAVCPENFWPSDKYSSEGSKHCIVSTTFLSCG